MNEELSTTNCFRCKGLAVLDLGHVRLLPVTLLKARLLLMKAKFNEEEDQEDIWNTMNSLLVYSNILDSIAVPYGES